VEKGLEVTFILYTLVRSDIPSMNAGKAAAQAQHAATMFSEHEIVRPLERGETPSAEVSEWRATTPHGFGTKLTLDCPDLNTLAAVIAAARKLGFPANIVSDDTYPYIVSDEIMRLIRDVTHTQAAAQTANGQWVCFRREVTCGYVFGEKTCVSVLLSQFRLMP
jgi:peptidyl-tRNA hydrolase